MKVTVITISDRAARGEYEDLSGPEIEKGILALYPSAVISRLVVPDDPEAILSAFESPFDADFILTTGGTGLSPRDVTPEVTMRFCDREIPGIAEMLRSRSSAETPAAMLSRGFAGHEGKHRRGEPPRVPEGSATVHGGSRSGHGARHADDSRRGSLEYRTDGDSYVACRFLPISAFTRARSSSARNGLPRKCRSFVPAGVWNFAWSA